MTPIALRITSFMSIEWPYPPMMLNRLINNCAPSSASPVNSAMRKPRLAGTRTRKGKRKPNGMVRRIFPIICLKMTVQ